METAIKNTIKLLAEKVTESTKSDDAMRFTQSALNLSHVLATLDNIERSKK